MKFIKYSRRIIKKFLLNLLFPIQCLNCHRAGQPLCLKCFKLLFNDPPPKKHFPDNPLVIPALDRIFIAGNYDNPLIAKLIKKFKYGFLYTLGETLGHFLIQFWSGRTFLLPDLKASKVLLIPIPLTKKRRQWRGFNQTEILARVIGQNFNYALSLDLKKIKSTPPQANLKEKNRLINIAGCFRWQGPVLTDQTLIIIDDVVTTGATINEAALCLRQAGAKKVYGLVLAKG